MRLVRLGPETAKVGVDLRAALASWGPADTVLGGIALLGVTPLGCPAPVEAVILLPRGVLVVVGIDLPDPALKLDAPLHGTWKADGWPLVRPDGAMNPAGEALAVAARVTHLIQASRLEPLPVSTVVTVGPYVGQVTQPTTDLHRGVRVLHPEPRPLLAAVRELAIADRPCSVEQARRLLGGLVGNRVPMLIGELAAEGFADAVTPDLASASTTVLPRITDRGPSGRRGFFGWPNAPRWLPIGALVLVAALLIAGIAVVVGTSGSDPAPPTAVAGNARPAPDVVAGGISFTPKGSIAGADCAAHAFGAVRSWLAAGHPCARLFRSIYQADVAGHPAAVARSVVDFTDPSTAMEFAALAAKPDQGGINDLVRDGEGWPGGPRSFDAAARTVTTRNTAVVLTAAVWLNRPSGPADPDLVRLATTAAALPVGR